jgi:hypothetical protein
MIKLTDHEWEILNSFKSNTINREEIFEKIQIEVSEAQKRELLLELKGQIDCVDKFSIILHKLPHRMSDIEYAEFCRFFINESWHREHEYFISVLGGAWLPKSKANIDSLIYIMNNLPEFYRHDDDLKYPFIRKCIYAIGAQPEPYNIEALEGLAKSEDEQIRELALHQIEKRK